MLFGKYSSLMYGSLRMPYTLGSALAVDKDNFKVCCLLLSSTSTASRSFLRRKSQDVLRSNEPTCVFRQSFE